VRDAAVQRARASHAARSLVVSEAAAMVDHQSTHLLPLQTVTEESETEQEEEDDVRSNSSTLKSSSERRGRRSEGVVGVVMTESTDSGLESDKNVDTTVDSSSRRLRHDDWLYHCQVCLPPSHLYQMFLVSTVELRCM